MIEPCQHRWDNAVAVQEPLRAILSRCVKCGQRLAQAFQRDHNGKTYSKVAFS